MLPESESFRAVFLSLRTFLFYYKLVNSYPHKSTNDAVKKRNRNTGKNAGDKKTKMLSKKRHNKIIDRVHINLIAKENSLNGFDRASDNARSERCHKRNQNEIKKYN